MADTLHDRTRIDALWPAEMNVKDLIEIDPEKMSGVPASSQNMKLLLDECTPKRLVRDFAQVHTVKESTGMISQPLHVLDQRQSAKSVAKICQSCKSCPIVLQYSVLTLRLFLIVGSGSSCNDDSEKINVAFL